MAAELPTERDVRDALNETIREMTSQNPASEYRYIFHRRAEAWDGANWSVTGAGRIKGHPTLIDLSNALDAIWRAKPMIK